LQGVNKMIDARPIISTLGATFPKAFFQYERRRKPIKLGIHRDIAALLPTLSTKEIGAAMGAYVHNHFYRSACTKAGAARIDLNGDAAGVVTPEEAADAVKSVAGMTAKWKANKAATKEAAARAKAEAHAAARAVEAAAARPVPTGINAGKPTLTLGAQRRVAP
jgi:ProP effector